MSRGLRVGAALAALLLSACGAYDETVEIFVPLHRLDLPEQPFRRFNAGQSGAASSMRVSLTDAQSSTPPDPQRPALRDDNGPFPLLFVEAYPTRWLSLGYEYAEYGNEDHGSVRAKVHLLGPAPGQAAPGDVSLAVTYGYADHDVDAGGYSGRTSLAMRSNDVAAIAGWRAARWLLFYGGPFHREQHYRGTHSNSNPPGGGGPLHMDFSGDLEMNGFNAGVSLTPGARWMNLLVEYANGRVEAGQSADEHESVNAALRFNFGWRMGER